MGVYRRGRVWWLEWYRGGKRYRESSRSTDREQALALLRKRRDTQPPCPRTPFDKLFTLLREDYRINGRRDPSRIERAAKHLRPFFSQAPIETASITAYTAHRLDEGAARATAARELNVLSKMLTLAVRVGMIPTKPMVPLPRLANTREGFITDAQVKVILRHLPPYLRGLVETLHLTGWRRGEVSSRQWKHVDREGGYLRLEPSETKNGRGRVFPLIPRLLDILDRQSTVSAWVFHRGGQRILSFRKAWKRACTMAGCPDAWPHDLRRSAVMRFERAGIPRSTAKLFTGHVTDCCYNRYAIVSEAMIQEGAAKLEAFLSVRD